MSPTFMMLLLATANPPVVPVPAMPQNPGCVACAPGMPGSNAGVCPPVGPPAPLLGVRVLAPNGVTVRFHPEDMNAKSYATPVTAGLRPGYRYTLELTNLPGMKPSEALYPVVEIHGSIVPRPGMKYMDYPAPIAISPSDIARVLQGGYVFKVVYLEDPTKAIPVEAKPDQPLEFTELSEGDAFQAARDSGRLVAVVRLGDRKVEREDLARLAIPGTVLLPGANALPSPTMPPQFPAFGVAMYDPILGPKYPGEECLTDGGDKGPRLGIGPLGKVGGLNTTDVALEYTVGGKRRVATSNEVCICAPRYVMRKSEIAPNGIQLAMGVGATKQGYGPQIGNRNIMLAAALNNVKPVGAITRTSLGLVVVRNGIAAFEGFSKAQGIVTISGVKVVVGSLEPDEITNTPNQFVVTKSVSPSGPVQPGDIVTFTIAYRNATLLPATDIILSDSLSARLEYVPGSAVFDRPTNATTLDNEAGSVIVRFEIPGPIAPGQSGQVQFKAKVR
jgi:uncharacterized repeat protein (TIGR01451 family)